MKWITPKRKDFLAQYWKHRNRCARLMRETINEIVGQSSYKNSNRCG